MSVPEETVGVERSAASRSRRRAAALAAASLTLVLTSAVAMRLPLAGSYLVGRGILLETGEVGGAVVSAKEYAPRDARAPVPAVLLLHGYLGRPSMLERLYAEELASRGMLAVVLRDFFPPAAGEPVERLRHDTARIRLALLGLQGDPRVDRERIAILGHSYGSTLATEAACADWSVAATVAIAPTLQAADYVNHVCPRNLLLIHGANDPLSAGYHQEMLLSRATRGLEKEAGVRHGDIDAGDARLLLLVPGAGHVDVLYDTPSRQRAIDWLQRSLLPSATPGPVTPVPVTWMAIGLIGVAVLLQSTSSLAWRLLPAEAASDHGSVRRWIAPGRVLRRMGAVVGIALVASLAHGMTPRVYEWLEPTLRTLQPEARVALCVQLVAAIVVAPLLPFVRCCSGLGGRSARSLLVAAGQIVLLGFALTCLADGYYLPIPRVAEVGAVLPAGPWLLLAHGSLALATGAVVSLAAPWGLLARVGLAAAIAWALAAIAPRFNDVAAPRIMLVPYAVAVACTIATVMSGAGRQPVLARAAFGGAFALWWLSLVVPLQ